jgi:hypothetical protein
LSTAAQPAGIQLLTGILLLSGTSLPTPGAHNNYNVSRAILLHIKLKADDSWHFCKAFRDYVN